MRLAAAAPESPPAVPPPFGPAPQLLPPAVPPPPLTAEEKAEAKAAAREHLREVEDAALEMIETISAEADGTPAAEVVKAPEDQEALNLLMFQGRVTGQTRGETLCYRRLF